MCLAFPFAEIQNLLWRSVHEKPGRNIQSCTSVLWWQKLAHSNATREVNANGLSSRYSINLHEIQLLSVPPIKFQAQFTVSWLTIKFPFKILMTEVNFDNITHTCILTKLWRFAIIVQLHSIYCYSIFKVRPIIMLIFRDGILTNKPCSDCIFLSWYDKNIHFITSLYILCDREPRTPWRAPFNCQTKSLRSG
jgi:hypothetical protein